MQASCSSSKAAATAGGSKNAAVEVGSKRPAPEVISLDSDDDSAAALNPARRAAPAPVFVPSNRLPTSLRGVSLPRDWGVHAGSLLVWRHLNPQPSSKVAAFDFDGYVQRMSGVIAPLLVLLSECCEHSKERWCQDARPTLCLLRCLPRRCLANTPLGGNDPNAWRMQFAHVPRVLQKLAESGHTLVVVTNESMDRLKKPQAISACVHKKCGRLEGFARAAGVPLLVLCATAKDEYRKPETGCWRYLVREAYPGLADSVDMAASFYVGDAAGREGDHSDSDRAFAKALGLRFYDERAFFLTEHPPTE